MNNCKTLYKILKYALKSNNMQYVENVRPDNITQLYNECKTEYVTRNNHVGGAQPVVEKHFIRMDYHGATKVDGILTVPDNTVVIIPLCCGMLYIPEIETFEFLENTSIEERMRRIDSCGNVINVGNQKFIILNSGDTYCDIYLDIRHDLNIHEGTFVDDEKIYKEDFDSYNNLVVTDEIIDILKIHYNYFIDSMIKSIMEEENKVANDNVLHITSHNNGPIIGRNYLYESMIQRFFYDKYYTKIYKKTEKIRGFDDFNKKIKNVLDKVFYNKILEDDDTEFTGIDIPYDVIKDVKWEDIFERIFIECRDSNYIVNSEFLKLISNQSLHKNTFTYKAFDNNNIKYFGIIDTKFSVEHEMMGDFWQVLYKKMFIISKLSDLEKRFYKEVLSTTTNVTLQNKIDFYRTNMNGKLYMFNISCQGFSSEKVCDSYKCLKLMNKKLTSAELTSELVYSQEKFEHIYEAITYINDNNLQQAVLGTVTSEVKESYYNTLCAFHKLKLEKPELYSEFFTLYLHKSYKPLYDYLISVRGHFNFPIEDWTIQQQFIKTILNLGITEIANTVSETHKNHIQNIMEK